MKKEYKKILFIVLAMVIVILLELLFYTTITGRRPYVPGKIRILTVNEETGSTDFLEEDRTNDLVNESLVLDSPEVVESYAYKWTIDGLDFCWGHKVKEEKPKITIQQLKNCVDESERKHHLQVVCYFENGEEYNLNYYLTFLEDEE